MSVGVGMESADFLTTPGHLEGSGHDFGVFPGDSYAEMESRSEATKEGD